MSYFLVQPIWLSKEERISNLTAQLTTKPSPLTLSQMLAACRNENKRSRSSSALNPLNGNVLGNENDKLIVDTTELQRKYNKLKGFNTELRKKYDKTKDLCTDYRNKYYQLKGLYFPIQERLQTEEVRFFVTL